MSDFEGLRGHHGRRRPSPINSPVRSPAFRSEANFFRSFFAYPRIHAGEPLTRLAVPRTETAAYPGRCGRSPASRPAPGRPMRPGPERIPATQWVGSGGTPRRCGCSPFGSGPLTARRRAVSGRMRPVPRVEAVALRQQAGRTPSACGRVPARARLVSALVRLVSALRRRVSAFQRAVSEQIRLTSARNRAHLRVRAARLRPETATSTIAIGRGPGLTRPCLMAARPPRGPVPTAPTAPTEPPSTPA